MTTTTEIPTIKEGDILLANWGYEANNPDFVKVIKRSGSMVTLMFLKNKFVKSDYTDCGNGYGSYVVPSDEPATWSVFANDDHVEGTPVIIRRKVKSGGYRGEYCKLSPNGNYAYAHLWDGQPAHDYNNH